MTESATANSRIKARIENLSDLVFGLALSIGSIILISKLPQTPYDLVSGIVLFGFSFLIIVWIWSGYTRIMVNLPFEIGGIFVLNVTLLFCVAVEPYLFYVLQSNFSLLDFSSSIYALDVGAMMLILADLTHLLIGEEKRNKADSLPPDRLKRLKRVMLAETITGVIFFASAIPFLWIPLPMGNYLRFDMWYIVLALFFALTRMPSKSPLIGSSRAESP